MSVQDGEAENLTKPTVRRGGVRLCRDIGEDCSLISKCQDTSGKKKAHKHKHFARVGLGTNAGFLQILRSSGDEKSNRHKQLLEIVLGMGGGLIGFCVRPFHGRKGKHINKLPKKSQENAGTVPGQSPGG